MSFLYIPLTTAFMSTETNEEHQNVPREEGQRGNSVSISATVGISDLEEKTFTSAKNRYLLNEMFSIPESFRLLEIYVHKLAQNDGIEKNGKIGGELKRQRMKLLWSSNPSDPKGQSFNEDKLRIMHNKHLEEYFESLDRSTEQNKPVGLVSMEDDVIEIKGTLYSTRVTTFNEYVGFLNLVKQDEIVVRMGQVQKNSDIWPRSEHPIRGIEAAKGKEKMEPLEFELCKTTRPSKRMFPHLFFAKPRSRGKTTMYRIGTAHLITEGGSTLRKAKPSLYYILACLGIDGQNGQQMDLFAGPGKSRSSVLDDLGSGGPMRRTRQKTPSLISSQPAWELEGSNGSKMAGKRRSYVLDDLGSGGPMRRIRQKADLCSQKKKRPFQMSAREDDLFELDDDDETRVNGHMSLLLVENLPSLEESRFPMSAPEDDSFETDDDDEIQVNGHVSNSVTTNDHAKLIESNKPANIFRKSESKDGNGNNEKAANIFGNLDAPASTASSVTPTIGISATTPVLMLQIFLLIPQHSYPCVCSSSSFRFQVLLLHNTTISVAERKDTWAKPVL
ncbi:hypothetical protein Tco_0743100 [Tanacetum coccineum]